MREEKRGRRMRVWERSGEEWDRKSERTIKERGKWEREKWKRAIKGREI